MCTAHLSAVASSRGAHPQAICIPEPSGEQGIQDGAQVNSIVPGPVMTGRWRSFLEKWAPAHKMSIEEATKQFPEKAGIRRYGRPEEIADLLAFMVSPTAKWMTRTCVRMDGGEMESI
jgi:3-oxoacyl-[acyl-carrier protein] reductase